MQRKSDNDPNGLAQLKHYRSLMPLAQEARKPMFLLNLSNGADPGLQSAAGARARVQVL